MNRFNRQIDLPGFSAGEQRKLSGAKVLVIGAGGLGCPALQYLAAMGAGKIGIVDGDTVSMNNLNRQVLYGETDAGKPKATLAATRLQDKYSDVRVDEYCVYLTSANAVQIISGYDMVLDCTDNFATRYLVNDACSLLAKPLVFAAIYRHEGQLMVFHPQAQPKLNYRHIYPHPPAADEIPDCNASGVLGVLAGIMGIFMAAEAVKVITGFGQPLINKIMYYNLTDHSRFITDITYDPLGDSLLPSTETELISRDYSLHCEIAETSGWSEVLKGLENENKSLQLIDVREPHETPRITSLPVLSCPLLQLTNLTAEDLQAGTLYVFCQTGVRSKKAVRILKQRFPEKSVLSVSGGITGSDSPANNKCYERT